MGISLRSNGGQWEWHWGKYQTMTELFKLMCDMEFDVDNYGDMEYHTMVYEVLEFLIIILFNILDLCIFLF